MQQILKCSSELDTSSNVVSCRTNTKLLINTFMVVLLRQIKLRYISTVILQQYPSSVVIMHVPEYISFSACYLIYLFH